MRCYASAVLAVIVCPSVTSQSGSKMAKCRIALTMPHNSQGLYFHDEKDLYETPKNACGVGKNCVFQPVKKSPTQTPYCATVIHTHDGALAGDNALSSTSLMIVKSDDQLRSS